MEQSRLTDTIHAMHAEARRRGAFFRALEGAQPGGAVIELDGRRLYSFSSCSYLGLEAHANLVEGAVQAARSYGSQFSTSRGYLSAPLYHELEALLERIFGGHVLVTSSTTIGHQVVLPVLADERDAIILDSQVHNSVQVAATLCRAAGTHVERVPHQHLERVVEIAGNLAARHRTVWLAVDGVYSMFGDLVPLGVLEAALSQAPNIRLYVDDAHGMSWEGKYGRGSFLSRMTLSDRGVVGTSLNKAFGAAGAVFVFPSAAERDRCHLAGAPLVFSGPIQPPMLGAAVASAELHLNGEVEQRQPLLKAVVDRAHALLAKEGIEPLVESPSPIVFLPLASPAVALHVVEMMRDDGYYVNASLFPSVPMRRAGIRLTLTTSIPSEVLEGAIECLGRRIPEALSAAGMSAADVATAFEGALPTDLETARDRRPVGKAAPAPVPVEAPAVLPSLRCIEVHDDISALDSAEWDGMLGERAAVSWASLSAFQRAFHPGQARPEDRWQFRYVVARDRYGRPTAAAPFIECLVKRDMLLRAEVSVAVEALRANDPYFLTARALMMGGLMSEGDHLFVAPGPDWKREMSALTRGALDVFDADRHDWLMFRDLPAGDERGAVLVGEGLIRTPMMPTHVLRRTWRDRAGHLERLGYNSRRHVRRLLSERGPYTAAIWGERAGRHLDDAQLNVIHGIYLEVASRGLELNVFPLPPNLLSELQRSSAWEIVLIHLDPAAGGPEDGAPVAFMATHIQGGTYAPFFCGVDRRYQFLSEYGAYRQLLFTAIERAEGLGCARVHFGMTASLEKTRLGAAVVQNEAFIIARPSEADDVLRDIAAAVAIGGGGTGR
jgi:7-keto-8-aminopelargonate synthetase-like enzyme